MNGVVYDTGVLVKSNETGLIDIIAISELNSGDWMITNGDGRGYSGCPGYSVYSGTGFVKIKGIVRGKSEGNIYRLISRLGTVDITAEAKVFSSDSRPITVDYLIPKETKLFCKEINIKGHSCEITPELAYILGVFMAKGTTTGNTSRLRLNSVSELTTACSELSLETPEFGMSIYTESEIFHEFYTDIDPEKRVPITILNSSREIQEQFLKGLYSDSEHIDTFSKNSLTGIFYLLQRTGRHPYINNDGDISIHSSELSESITVSVTDITSEYYSTYIYSLETDTGLFHGSVGNLLICN